MPKITSDIQVDVTQFNTFPAIIAKQFDKSARFLKVQFLKDGELIEIESSASVVINARRADDQSKSFSGVVNADGTVTVPISYWMLELDDKVSCDITIVNESEESELSSTLFYIDVQESASQSDEEISNDENGSLLLDLLKRVEPFDKAMTTVKSSASTASSKASAASYSASTASTAATKAQTALTKIQSLTDNLPNNWDELTTDVAEIKTAISDGLKTDNKRHFIVIGDSFCEGYTPDRYVDGWGTLFKEAIEGTNQGTVEAIYAKGGLAFVENTYLTEPNSFLELLQQYTGDKEKITDIIVGSGANEPGDDSAIMTAGEAFINYVASNFPNAKVYLGAWASSFAVSGTEAGKQKRFREHLYPTYARLCDMGNVVFIESSPGVLHDRKMVSSDLFHPNKTGQLEILRSVLQAINGHVYYQNQRIAFTTDDANVCAPNVKVNGSVSINAGFLNIQITELKVNTAFTSKGAHFTLITAENLRFIRPGMLNGFTQNVDCIVVTSNSGSTPNPKFYECGAVVYFDTSTGDLRMRLNGISDDGSYYAEYKNITQIHSMGYNITLPLQVC